MNNPVNTNGRLGDTTIAEIFSAAIKSGLKSCDIIFLNNGFRRTVRIKDGRIMFIYSEDPGESFSLFLKSNSALSENDLSKALSESESRGTRLGKVLCELDLFSYENLWSYIREHQVFLLHNIYKYKSGEYTIHEHSGEITENILLDLPISDIILFLIRQSDFSEKVREKFEIVNKVFVKNRSPKLPHDLLAYEKHVFQLCLKYRDLNKILSESELKESDTLKYVFYYFLTDIVTTEKTETRKGEEVKDYISVNISFSSYEEALKHYNMKFEMIYKILSKEIGPVALSILSKSIDDIRDNLPIFLKGAELDKNGKLMDKKILKKVWYHDFENHSSEFVRGLEELLYAQIFAVKKNLGIEYENQILKWLKGTGN